MQRRGRVLRREGIGPDLRNDLSDEFFIDRYPRKQNYNAILMK